MIEWFLVLLESLLTAFAKWVKSNPETAAVFVLGLIVGKVFL